MTVGLRINVEEFRCNVLRLFLEGKNEFEISAILNVSVTKVKNVMPNNKSVTIGKIVDLKKIRLESRIRAPTISDELHEQITQMYKNGESPSDISEKLNMNYSTVQLHKPENWQRYRRTLEHNKKFMSAIRKLPSRNTIDADRAHYIQTAMHDYTLQYNPLLSSMQKSILLLFEKDVYTVEDFLYHTREANVDGLSEEVLLSEMDRLTDFFNEDAIIKLGPSYMLGINKESPFWVYYSTFNPYDTKNEKDLASSLL